MAGDAEPTNRPQISPIDRLGRPIDPVVLAEAERLVSRVLPYAERALRDSALAVSLLEECAAAVSRVLRSCRNPQEQPIKDIRAYLFRAFIRRVNRIRRREMRFSVVYRNEPRPHPNPASDLELKLLIEEIMARCDPVIKDMFHRRVRGFSWREIGEAHGISAHAAEARFSAALRRVRKRLGLDE